VKRGGVPLWNEIVPFRSTSQGGTKTKEGSVDLDNGLDQIEGIFGGFPINFSVSLPFLKWFSLKFLTLKFSAVTAGRVWQGRTVALRLHRFCTDPTPGVQHWDAMAVGLGWERSLKPRQKEAVFPCFSGTW
jgi:hypothetical protein